MRQFDEIYEERIKQEIFYMKEKDYTVRKIAEVMCISKSTVFKDLNERLKNYSLIEYQNIRLILDVHRSTRHMRGGEATRLKFRRMKMK